MDAYDLQRELLKAWQKLGLVPDASSIKKEWNNAPVFVEGRKVIGVNVVDNKIELVLE